ncbi:MAG TPA: chemotaxis protein CheW [Bacillota bacterium]|nr:chemotaxis protein CheW [Bacillota bacterium]
MAHLENVIDVMNLTDLRDSDIQHVVFTIYTEEFGIDILDIKEVVKYVQPLPVPNAGKFVKGIINFRGEVIPVIDLRGLFGLMSMSVDENTAIVVVEIKHKIFGLIVDHVTDVMSIPEALIRPHAEFEPDGKGMYVKAVGDFGKRMVFLLDLVKILEFQQIDSQRAS